MTSTFLRDACPEARLQQTAVMSQWQSRGFTCKLWMAPPQQRWEEATHRRDTLLMLISGQVELQLNGRILHPRPGEEVLIPAGTPYSLITQGRLTSSWFYGFQQSMRPAC